MLKYLIAIISPIILPPFMDYIMKFSSNLHFILNSLIYSCVQLFAILSILFALVPALSQYPSLNLRAGSYFISGLGNTFQNIGNNYKFK